jgi:hypothetical protein
MPTFVPGFEHDLFVSYVHVDNRKYGQEIGWVETLVENIREALPQKLGRDQPDIWRDPRLSSNEPFPMPSIKPLPIPPLCWSFSPRVT